MQKLKTSELISVKFTVFTILILFVFGITLNSYIFYNLYSQAKTESIKNIDLKFNETFGKGDYDKIYLEKGGIAYIKQKFINEILSQGGYVIEKTGELHISSSYSSIPATNTFGYFKKNGKYYLLYGKELLGIGEVKIFTDLSSYVEFQYYLIKVTLILLIIFALISWPISNYFTRTSLRNLMKIAIFAKNIDFNNLKKTIEIDSPDDDEIKILACTLNNALKKIDAKAEKLKEFTGDAAHEFKTPLMTINSEIDYALKSKKYKGSLEKIKTQIKALNQMVVSLLSLARLDSDKLNMKSENITDIVQNALIEIEEAYKNADINTEFTSKKNIIKEVDRNLFEIALKNIISNAFRYTKKGKIEVILSPDKLIIKDTGKGISEENINKIWERFFKEDSSRSTSTTDSHGLGLALTKEIIEKHGFNIFVESKVGVGTSVIVNF